MRLLTLIRHASAGWAEAPLGDFERPLTAEGCTDAETIGARLAGAGVLPDLILSSPAYRAAGTARIIARELEYPESEIGINEALYTATTSVFLELVGGTRREMSHLAMVSHNPGITEFSRLLGVLESRAFPTCGVARLELSIDSWSEVAAGCAVLLGFDQP